MCEMWPSFSNLLEPNKFWASYCQKSKISKIMVLKSSSENLSFREVHGTNAIRNQTITVSTIYLFTNVPEWHCSSDLYKFYMYLDIRYSLNSFTLSALIKDALNKWLPPKDEDLMLKEVFYVTIWQLKRNFFVETASITGWLLKNGSAKIWL